MDRIAKTRPSRQHRRALLRIAVSLVGVIAIVILLYLIGHLPVV